MTKSKRKVKVVRKEKITRQEERDSNMQSLWNEGAY